MVIRNTESAKADLVILIVVGAVCLGAAGYFWAQWSEACTSIKKLNVKLKASADEQVKLGVELQKVNATLGQTKMELEHLKKDPVIFQDRFTANTVDQAWQIVSGEAQVIDGSLQLQAKDSATAVCRVPLRGDYQIEYDAQIEEKLGADGFSDLSCFLGGETNNTLSTGYFIGFGSDLNKTFRIARVAKDVANKDAVGVLKEKTPYHVRVTWKAGTVSLFYREGASNKEIPAIDFQDSDPLGKTESRYFGLYVWGSRSRFSNVRVTPLQ
jgi:hypothetical protein